MADLAQVSKSPEPLSPQRSCPHPETCQNSVFGNYVLFEVSSSWSVEEGKICIIEKKIALDGGGKATSEFTGDKRLKTQAAISSPLLLTPHPTGRAKRQSCQGLGLSQMKTTLPFVTGVSGEKRGGRRAEGMAQLVKCLPHRRQALSLIPRTHITSAMSWRTCNTRTGKIETGGDAGLKG